MCRRRERGLKGEKGDEEGLCRGRETETTRPGRRRGEVGSSGVSIEETFEEGEEERGVDTWENPRRRNKKKSTG